MVPYDQPEAALVRCYPASKYAEMLTYPTCPGYDYPMGQECSSDELIRRTVSHVLHSVDTIDNTRACGSLRRLQAFLMP